MAGLLNTYVQDIRTQYPNNNDKNEWRFSKYGVLEYFKRSTTDPNSIVSSDLIERARNAEGIAIKIPVMDGGLVNIGNARTCTIAADENESALVDVTFATLTANLVMTPAQYNKNDIKYMEDFRKKWLKIENSMALHVEQLCAAKMDADKSSIWASSLVGGGSKYGALVGDAAQVFTNNQGFVFNDLPAIMMEGDFYGPQYDVIGSTSLLPYVSKLSAQGGGNAVNSAFQFQGMDFTYSNRITNGANKNATFYVAERGNFGIINQNSDDANAGRVTTKGTEFGTVFLDELGMEVGYTYYSECKDQSLLNGTGLGHLTATVFEAWQIHTNIALISAYNSDPSTNEGAVHKFEFVNGAS